MATSKKITLKSSDGEVFEVEEVVALESQMIKHMIEDGFAESVIPLPNVDSKILAKVIEYCKKHVETPKSDDDDKSAEDERWEADFVPLDQRLSSLFVAKFIEFCKMDDELKAWDADFVKVDLPVAFDLIRAANYLNIESLLGLTCQAVADMIKGMTPEEISKTLNIKCGFTPEEEEELSWEIQCLFK